MKRSLAWLAGHFRAPASPHLVWLAWMLGIAVMILYVVLMAVQHADARDAGQWENVDPAQSAWFRRQMQPDNPTVSCCGPADGYEADEFVMDGEQYFAIITDTREDGPLMRPHIPAGTRIYIPPTKIKRDNSDPNITGHGIVFIGVSGQVFCYFAPSLI